MSEQERKDLIMTLWSAFKDTGNIKFYLRMRKLEQSEGGTELCIKVQN